MLADITPTIVELRIPSIEEKKTFASKRSEEAFYSSRLNRVFTYSGAITGSTQDCIFVKSEATMRSKVAEKALPHYFTKNLNKLQAAYNNELIRYVEYLPIEEKKAKSMFNELVNEIAELPFKDGTVEFTNGKGFKFTLSFPKNKLLMISRSIKENEIELNSKSVIFSLFINREFIASDVSHIEKFKDGINKLLSV
jgi:hypothetical protein